jgi:hypothetical protein
LGSGGGRREGAEDCSVAVGVWGGVGARTGGGKWGESDMGTDACVRTCAREVEGRLEMMTSAWCHAGVSNLFLIFCFVYNFWIWTSK